MASGSNGATERTRRGGGSVSRPPLSFLALPLLVVLSAVVAAVLILRGEPGPATHYRSGEQDRFVEVTPTTQEERQPAAAAARAIGSPFPDDTPPAEQPGVELRVEATEKTWLSVSADGGESVGMLLKPGEKRKWRALQGFELTVGNTGGVKFVLDGVELSPLGSSGQVIRSLELPAGWRREATGR